MKKINFQIDVTREFIEEEIDLQFPELTNEDRREEIINELHDAVETLSLSYSFIKGKIELEDNDF